MIPRPSLRRPRGALLVSLVVACGVIAALTHVYIHLQVIHLGYDLGRERKIHHDLSQQNQKLRLELSTRGDPAVIERRARDELHMAPPEPKAIRVLVTDDAVPPLVGELAAALPRREGP